MPSAGLQTRFRRLALAAILLALAVGSAPAEIYQWVDEAGTIHFTDELSSVPPSVRGKSRVLLREAPITVPAPQDQGYSGSPPTAAEPDPGAAAEVDDLTDPVTAAEQLRAKIAAKEQLIESVDRKRSLATSALKNRFVSPSDMELYRKYQAELPGDRERLKELESLIDSLNR